MTGQLMDESNKTGRKSTYLLNSLSALMMPHQPMAPKQSGVPTAAAIFLILAGILDLIAGLFLITGAGAIASIFPDLGVILLVCGSLVALFAIMAFVGAMYSIKRTKWSMALLGSILAIFGIGPYFLGSICVIIALILVAISKDEYDAMPMQAMMGGAGYPQQQAPGYQNQQPPGYPPQQPPGYPPQQPPQYP